MPVTFIPFDGWKPGGGYFGEGWPIAGNLYPGFGSTGHPWRVFTPAAGSVADGPMLGSHSHVWASGVGTGSYTPDAQTKFAGSKTALYSVDPATGAFTNISRGGGYSAAGQPAGWRFASIGNDVWACNWYDVMQRRTNNAGNFANGVLGSTVFVPRFMAPIREHLAVANMNQGGRFQDEFAWSDADDATNFDPPTGPSTSLAGAKRLTSIPGQITGLLGGQYGLAFKRRGIYYLEYTGTTQIFRPDVLSATVGTAYPSSIIRTRHGVFFLGSDGFYQITGLSEPVKISPPGVDQFLLETAFAVEPAGLTAWEEDTQAEASAPANEPRVTWGYRDNAVGIGAEHVIHYNPETQQWGYGDMSPAFLGAMMSYNGGADFSDSTAGFTWDGTVSKYARYSTGVSADQYQSVLLELRFRPANVEQVRTQAQSIVRGLLPMFSKTFAFSSDALQPTLNLDSALDPFQTGYATEGPRTYAQRDSISGFYPFQSAGRFFRLRMSIPASLFENFHGVWIDQDPLV
jgi:hypothetical protein